MADNLRKANIKNLQAGVFSLGWRKGSEVVEIDESRLPDFITDSSGEEIPIRYHEVSVKIIGKPELKKLLKENEIPGVSLVRKPDSLAVK
jgi:hypothetical protein